MPKLKTHSGAAKRFHKTGTGKFKRGQSKMRHILTSKATKTKRHLGGLVLVSKADQGKSRPDASLRLILRQGSVSLSSQVASIGAKGQSKRSGPWNCGSVPPRLEVA